MPTLIMTHNKTLAAQLYSEFKAFFRKIISNILSATTTTTNLEAYIPRQDLFIEKDSSINDELERLRLSATASLLQFDDCIVVASVSANYGLGDPAEYKTQVQTVEIGMSYSQREFLLKLVDMGYKRNDNYFDRGDFRVSGKRWISIRHTTMKMLSDLSFLAMSVRGYMSSTRLQTKNKRFERFYIVRRKQLYSRTPQAQRRNQGD